MTHDPLHKYKHEICFTATSMYLSLSALFLMLLSWLMALLFSMDVLAWLAFISLLCLCKETAKSQINLLLMNISVSNMLLHRFEFKVYNKLMEWLKQA